jgi:hypothetical protein
MAPGRLPRQKEARVGFAIPGTRAAAWASSRPEHIRAGQGLASFTDEHRGEQMDEDRGRVRLRAERTEVQILLKDTEGQDSKTGHRKTRPATSPTRPSRSPKK